MATFNERIKELRKQRKVSQTKLAMAVDVDKSSVSKWESGDRLPSWDVAQRIANYFSVTLEYLMGISSDPSREASLDDISEYAAQNVIYEDESDAEIVNMFIGPYAPREAKLVKEEPVTPSSEALAFARSFDKLDRYGQELLRAVLRVEEKRCENQYSLQAYTCDLPEN